MTKEEVLKDIEDIKDSIELEKSFNKNSGNLSFLYWQLYQSEKQLKELEEKENEHRND